MLIALSCGMVRSDLAGVSSLVRAGWLKERCYRRLLHLFHSDGLDINKLTESWTKLACRIFSPVRVGNYVVCVGDGIKIPKEGKKMPAVKSLHNDSDNNSKAEFIMGHSFQAISLLAAGPANTCFAVPLISRITEGIVLCNACKKTLLDKFVDLFRGVSDAIGHKVIVALDAYYASRKIILPIIAEGHHVITRMKATAVAHLPPPPNRRRGRGRPRKYGKKVKLESFFGSPEVFTEAASPVYGEKNVTIRYFAAELLWKPVQRKVRFVFVQHPKRGCIVLVSTNMSIDPLEVLRVYSLRFKIEVGFKQSVHVVGTYSYHFWMMDMNPIKRRSGNQHIHRASKEYRDAVLRKLEAYHRYVQIGCIAQGLMQHLAVNFRERVWKSFRSWMRTMRPDLPPSELVVATALRTELPGFIAFSSDTNELAKIISENMDPERLPGWCMAA
jgi:hypothetical protein